MTRTCRDQNPSAKVKQIIEALQGRLATGLAISAETLFFADSTYGISTADLESVLADESFEDRNVLLELICFPDRKTRMCVEKIADGCTFEKEQESSIQAALIRQTGRIRLYTKDRTEMFEICLPGLALSGLVTKLYLTRRLDEAICSCLDEQLDRETAIRAKVILRCRGDRFAPDSSKLLCRLAGSAAGRTDFIELFQAGLEILAGRVKGMSSEQCFLKKQQELLDSLKTIRDFNRKQKQYGFEYLLMQRYPVPTDSEDLVLARLRVVLMITDELLRLGPASAAHPLERRLGDFTSEDFEQLIRTLS